jgi:hypothetical protein
MSVVSSSDGVLSCTVAIVQEPDGKYALQITSVMPEDTPMAVEIGGTHIYEGLLDADSGSEG